MKRSHALALLLLVSGCGAGTTASVGPAGDFGPQTLTMINSYRVSKGLPPLAFDGTLERVARQHSVYQARRNRMTHEGFRDRMEMARGAGLGGRCTENAGVRYRNAQQLFAGWRNSPAHDDNMLRPHLRHAGVSVVGAYSTFFACG